MIGAIAAGAAALGSGLIQTGLSYNESVKNRHLQEKQFEYQKELNEKLMNREDTAYQRQVNDLRAAGLSPLMAAGGAGAGGTVSGGTAPQQNTDWSGIGQGGANFASAIQSGLELSQKTQTDRTMQELEKQKLRLETEQKDWDVHFRNLEEAHRITDQNQRQQALDDENTRFRQSQKQAKEIADTQAEQKQLELNLKAAELSIQKQVAEAGIEKTKEETRATKSDTDTKIADEKIARYAGLRSTDQLDTDERNRILSTVSKAYMQRVYENQERIEKYIKSVSDPVFQRKTEQEKTDIAVERICGNFKEFAEKYMDTHRLHNASGGSQTRKNIETAAKYVPTYIFK